MKLKLVWIDCPTCEGGGGWEYRTHYDDYDWVTCYMCRGSGKAQKPIRVKEKNAKANAT